MKYILKTPEGSFDLNSYGEYLDRALAGFAFRIHAPDLATIDRVLPIGPGSFHDSRLERLAATAAAGNPGERPSVSIELRLKGPHFDRYFDLHYMGVVRCILQLPTPEDDLLVHEIREEDGLLVHEFLFAGDKTVEVGCREVHFRETVEAPRPL